MDDFCNDGSTFWNRSITWDTTDPYFTSCFEETILVWVPAGFLIFFALLDLNYSLKSKYANDPIPWNLLSILKSLVCVALIAVALAELIKIQGYEQSKAIDSVSSAARLVSYILALVLLVLAKVKGIRSSGVQFLFWLLATICEAILFRTAVRKYESSDDTRMNFVYLMRFIIFPLVAIQLILNCWADGNWANKSGKESIFGFPPPDKSSSYLSKLLYLWYDSMAWKGYRQPLSFDDLWDLNDADKAGVQLPIFQEHWNEAVKRAKEQSKKAGKKVEAGIMSVLWKCYGTPFMAGGLMKLIQDLLAFVSPEILKMLMAHVTANRLTGELTEESWKGYLYASILLVVGLIQTLFGVQHNKRMMLVGMKIRTTLSSAVYRKALLVSTAAKKDTTVGEIVNLMSVDTQKFMDLAPMVHMAWTAPIQVALSIYFLYNILGPAVFAGLAVMVLLIPLNGVVSGMARSLQFRQMKLKDRRVKLMSEFLAGMKVLKLYGWEPSFQEQIMKIRAQELKLLKKAAMLNTSIMFMFTCAPYLVSLATFATYVLSDETHNLNAERAFVSLTLFNIMRMPLTMFPMVIASLVQASVSVQRLNKYMNSEEIDLTAVSHKENSEEPITIKKGKFSWTDETITLQDIDFTVKKGSLTAVVGSVGSGKSSLLGSLLGDLKKHEGDVNISGSVAFVSQGAWIQNATLRENILFNDPFILSKYNKVIKACNLEPDLDILEAGDQTEIGEKGINLSGGQKQRVSLARAAYKESEVYLFDDPLSAVDSHVGKHIFDQLIGPGGILRDKTRVLVTHGVAFLPQVDNIVVMADGRISEVGTFKELLSRKGKFAEFLTQHLTNLSDGEELDMSLVQELEDVVGADVFKRNSSLVVRRRSTQDSLGKQKDEMSVVEKPKPKLMQEEIAETGSVKLEVYADYLRTAGIGMSITTLVMNLIATGSATYSNIWLSDWSTEATLDEIKNNGTQDRDTTNLYLGVYGGLGGINAFAILFASLTLALATLRSAASLHFRMLDRVMKAPMSYFDTTPLGRLVNRFAKDVDTTDILVPMNIRASLNIVLNVLSAVVNISYSTPFFLIFIIPLFIFYFFMQRFYVATSRQLKRIESVTRSPIYSKFGETISGSTTIRAFNLQEDFIGESEKKIDINQQAYFPYIASSLWIAVRLEALGSLIVFAAAIFAVTARETIEASVVGLSISSALTFTGLLNFLVRTTSDLETNIIAVERMKELTTAPQEAAWIGEKRPRKEWPENGAVEFKDYQTRYREGLDLVLRGITCKINPGEKIGIVGRTGAGKSSLTLALFRLVEPVAGSICIDGQNITEIGLHDLRQKITIIPQDPVLFSGNLQGNLDPFGVFSDDQLWTCLESAHLKQYVSSLPLKLQHEVAEEGQNFSVGQRQLVCLARALLRKTKILVLDEATAAVDLETDDLIQRTIRTEFEHSTVLTIAHRLNTIMDSTRVVVLDKGEIVEFDTPANLLENTNSIFYSMAKDAGLV